mgnify:CR=1 FL=1
MLLTQLMKGRIARVTRVDWAALPPTEAHRLRMLGLDAGVEVELLHSGVLFWRDPLAVRVGRMTVALRRRHAAAVACAVEPAAAPAFEPVAAE